jgi:Calcineurin-like phosphoesterase
MIDEVVSKTEMQRYVSAMREQLAAGHLDGPAAAAARAIGAGDEDARTAMLSRMPDPANLKQSSGGDAPGMPFIARDPITSLLQSELDKRFREAAMVQERHLPADSAIVAHERVVREQPDIMGPDDKQFGIDVYASVLQQVSKGNHEFNSNPAEYEIKSDYPLLIVVGDWGSGSKPAQQVGKLMGEQIQQAGQRPVAVIHLGDVYPSGQSEDYQNNFLPYWPVPQGGLSGVTSWSLNGNHDMYSGAWYYFDYLLADARFAKQRSAVNGEPTSFFRLRTPSWDLVGLDTAWHSNVVDRREPLAEEGDLDDPQGKQATAVAGWANDAKQNRRALMLLSHHQFVSAFTPSLGEGIEGTLTVAPKLKNKLGPVLSTGRVRAWLWGHEHRCVGFKALNLQPSGISIAYPRCLGHGGMHMPPYTADGPPQGVSFLERGTELDDGTTMARCGFAVLDFAADGSIAVSYYDDHSEASPPAETFTPA